MEKSADSAVVREVMSRNDYSETDVLAAAGRQSDTDAHATAGRQPVIDLDAALGGPEPRDEGRDSDIEIDRALRVLGLRRGTLWSDVEVAYRDLVCGYGDVQHEVSPRLLAELNQAYATLQAARR